MQEDIDKIAVGTGDRFFGSQTAYGYQYQGWIGRLRLHQFFREDPGAAHHDHPWPFWTFPLTSYVEDVLDIATGIAKRDVVKRLRITYRPATHTHRVIGPWDGTIKDGVPQTKPGTITTIVWRGPIERDWSYWRIGRGKVHKYPWRSYLELIEKKPARPE